MTPVDVGEDFLGSRNREEGTVTRAAKRENADAEVGAVLGSGPVGPCGHRRD